MAWMIANLMVLALNFAVLALSIKLYTEILKDQSQDRRAARKQGAKHD